MEDFKTFFEDVKSLIKAIGTSSSANEERDERSVENYVRGNSNTNTNNQIGGTIVSNTTEPDPQGDIAVTKAYPDATSDAKHVIGSATNPNGDIDPAIADTIALRILGDDFIFIEPMSTKVIFHYMKEGLVPTHSR